MEEVDKIAADNDCECDEVLDAAIHQKIGKGYSKESRVTRNC